MQLYKYLYFLYVRHKNVIPSAFLFYLRISAAHKLPTRVSYQLLQPASTHVGRIYPRLVDRWVQKGHLYSIPLSQLPDSWSGFRFIFRCHSLAVQILRLLEDVFYLIGTYLWFEFPGFSLNILHFFKMSISNKLPWVTRRTSGNSSQHGARERKISRFLLLLRHL